MSLAFRTATVSDAPFVIGAWIDSYRTAHAAGLINMDDWHDVMRPQLDRVLAREGVRVYVAFSTEADPGNADLYGFAVVEDREPKLVHYVFVKQAYRRLGVATALLKELGVELGDRFDYTCKTGVVSRLKAVIPNASWRPHIARHSKSKP